MRFFFFFTNKFKILIYWCPSPQNFFIFLGFNALRECFGIDHFILGSAFKLFKNWRRQGGVGGLRGRIFLLIFLVKMAFVGLKFTFFHISKFLFVLDAMRLKFEEFWLIFTKNKNKILLCLFPMEKIKKSFVTFFEISFSNFFMFLVYLNHILLKWCFVLKTLTQSSNK